MISDSSGYVFSGKFVLGNVSVNSIWPDGVAVYLWWITWHQPLHGLIVAEKDDDANFNG